MDIEYSMTVLLYTLGYLEQLRRALRHATRPGILLVITLVYVLNEVGIPSDETRDAGHPRESTGTQWRLNEERTQMVLFGCTRWQYIRLSNCRCSDLIKREEEEGMYW